HAPTHPQGTMPPPHPGFVVEAAAAAEPPRGATWSSELDTARSPAADDTWSLGATAEIADERRRHEPSSGSKAPVILVLLLVIAGLGTGAYFAFGPGGGPETPGGPEIGPGDSAAVADSAATSGGAVAATGGTTAGATTTAGAGATTTAG